MTISVGLVVGVWGGPRARAYGQVNIPKAFGTVQAIRAPANHHEGRPLAESAPNPDSELWGSSQHAKAQGTKLQYLGHHPRAIQKGLEEKGRSPYISQPLPAARPAVADLRR